jgi:hypothetical protein
LSTADASKSAGATGIELRFDDDDFALSAAAAPHAAVLDALSQHKTGIVALLRPGRDGWSAEDWQAYFDERAGVAEFAGGLSRAEAEAHALDGCGEVEQPHDPLQPFGLKQTGCVWLHLSCRPAWHANRSADAVAALSEILRSG